MEEVLTPIISAQEVADAHRYGEEEHVLIEDFVLGAQALLHNAGAFKPNNAMTRVVVTQIVGHWLENRDAMNYDYKSANGLPYSLQAMIYSLQYLPDKEVVDDGT